ncbi:MAG: hypothetical protein HOC23_18255 [Halieaceae bacterium]|jgi:hypothetical protein|nr:hypothetical protein [Halieaceae bacterium]
MNDYDELLDKAKLPLPSPVSPPQLDETILAYARDNAPARRPSIPPWWFTGVATASVVTVALFITLPQQTSVPTLEDRFIELPRHASKETETTTVDRTTSTTNSVALEKAQMTVQRRGKNLTHAKAKPKSAPAQASTSTKHKVEKRAINDAQMSAIATEIAPAASFAGAVPAIDINASEEMSADMQLGYVSVELSEEKLVERIEELAEALVHGDEKLALKTYKSLRQQCPSCDLPKTLAEAINRYLQPDSVK